MSVLPAILLLLGQILLCLTAVLIVTFWSFLRKLILPSTLKNLPGPPRQSFWKGNLGQLFDNKGWDFHRNLVKQYGGAVKLNGLCGDEQVYVSDPKALYHIVIKDQDVYEETEYFTKSNLVCFGAGMVSVTGEQHRKQRKMMNPVFNINHIRSLTPIFYRIAHDLCNVWKNQFEGLTSGESIEINVHYWLKRTALEYIGQAGLGYSFGSLADDNTSEYSESVRMFAPVLFRSSILRQFLPFFSKIGPKWLQKRVVEWLPIDSVRRLRAIVDVMDRTAREVFDDKKRRLLAGDNAVKAQVGEGRDIMSVLLKENTKSAAGDRLADEELLGQMSTLIFAAQDTSSGALSRVLHELALHPDVQERLRKEVIEARALSKGDVQYDELHGLPYLDAVIRETLRLHPPVYMLHRTTQKDVTLPLLHPVLSTDGKSLIDAIPLRRNTNVIIAIEAANRRTDIWGPDAGEWRPERWLGALPKSVEAAHLPCIYSSMMTFLGGGRSCIGFKFAQLEIKVTLALLLEHFRFELPTDKKLAWKLGGIVSPGVENDPMVKLPLRVSLASGVS